MLDVRYETGNLRTGKRAMWNEIRPRYVGIYSKIILYKFNLISYLTSNISYLKKNFVSLQSIERVRHRYGLV